MAKSAQINISINTQNAIKSMADLNNEIGDSVVTIQDLRMTVDALTQELESTEYGTDRWNELKRAVIDANTELKNYELSVESLDHEQVATEIKSVVGGLTDMAGGMALVGASGESMEKIVQLFAQVEGVSKIATGAMEGYTSMMKLSGTITKTLTGWQTALAAAQLKGGITSKAAAVGMRILNAAMNANPVFLIITGITALIGGLAWFVTSTNEAAEAQGELNSEMEAQNKIMQSTRKLRNAMLTEQTSANDVKIKQEQATLNILKLELKNLQKKIDLNQELTEDEQMRFERLPGYIQAAEDSIERLTFKNFNKRVNAARATVEENSGAMEDKFESLRLAIQATRNEDWGDEDINYTAMIGRITAAEGAFKKLQERMETGDVTTAFYQREVRMLTEDIANLNADIGKLDGTFGNDGTEEWKKAIDAVGELDKGLADVVQSAVDYNKVQREGFDLDKEFGMFADNLDKQQTKQEELEALEKSIAENRKRRLKQRQDKLKQILELLGREENSTKELARTKAELANDEIELINISYGEEREKIINSAIAREEALLQQKFIDGKLNEKELKEALIDLNENYEDYLLDSEKELLEAKEELRKQEIQSIQERYNQEKKISKESRDVIITSRRLSTLQFEKEMELMTARTEKEKLAIREKYLVFEIQAIKDNLVEQKELLKVQLEAQLANEKLSLEEKKRLREQYLSDVKALEQEAAIAIQSLTNQTTQGVEHMNGKVGQWAEGILEFYDKIASTVQTTLNTIQMAWDVAAENQTAKLEQEYANQVQAAQDAYGERLISEQEFANQVQAIEEEKADKERALRMKSFKQQKAMNIANAVINGAQAVLQALASMPPPLSYVLAAVNAALAGVQVGIISSQKFTGNRGGKVPGQPSTVDSVDALLAPGEMVINAQSSSMFPELLSDINQAGGGIPLAPESPSTQKNSGNNTFKEQGPLQAYVVESQLSQTSKRVRRMQNAATFG